MNVTNQDTIPQNTRSHSATHLLSSIALSLVCLGSGGCLGGPTIPDESATAGEIGGADFYNFSCSNRVNWVTGVFPCTESINGFCDYGDADPYYIPRVNACAYVNNPDAYEDDIGSIRAACSERCAIISDGAYLCDDDNWLDIKHAGLGYQLCKPLDGQNGMNYGELAEKLGETVANSVVGLECGLSSTCASAFGTLTRLAMWDPAGSAGLGADVAERSAEASGASVLEVRNLSTKGIARAAIVGNVAYTARECGADSCPFFLGSLEGELGEPLALAVLGADSERLDLDLISGTARLDAPTLGVWVPATGDVVFPARTIRLVLDYDFGSSVLGELGTGTITVVNHEPIYGSVQASGFTLGHSFTDLTQEVSLSLEFRG